MQEQPRALFVGDGASLAHVSRCAVLAADLSRRGWNVSFAFPNDYEGIVGNLTDTLSSTHDLTSLSPAAFQRRLATGQPIFDRQTLESFIDQDLRLLEEVRPDVVVGDFRVSLSISARLASVPYIAIADDYWSPYAEGSYPLPDTEAIRWLGDGLVEWVFQTFQSSFMRRQTRAIDELRAAHGLPRVHDNLSLAYTDADRVAYVGLPGAEVIGPCPSTHGLIGPVLWEPPVDLPTWWNDLPRDRRCAYVSLGSSGSAGLLPKIVDTLVAEGMQVMVAGVGRMHDLAVEHVWQAPYLPGLACAARADLVVCNGGSPSTHQALSVGTPVLGVCSNMDQHMNMRIIDRLNAGRWLRANTLDARELAFVTRSLLSDAEVYREANSLRMQIAESQPARALEKIMASLVAEHAIRLPTLGAAAGPALGRSSRFRRARLPRATFAQNSNVSPE